MCISSVPVQMEGIQGIIGVERATTTSPGYPVSTHKLSLRADPETSFHSAAGGRSAAGGYYHCQKTPDVLLQEEVAMMLSEQEKASIPSKEYVQQLYLGETPAATLRSSLIDWMVDASQGLCLSSDATFLGVQLLDRYLQTVVQGGVSAPSVFSQSSQLQLIAITALWVAAKFEGSPVPPATAFSHHLPYSMPPVCKHKQLLAAEQALLTALDHRLACPTPKSFLRRYMSSLCQAQTLDKRVYFTAGYLAELSLLDAGMLCYRPSAVAASAYAWALAVTGNTCSESHLKQYTGCDLEQISPCMQRLARVHIAACNTSRPCIISLKYLVEDLGQVAALPPVGQEQVFSTSSTGAACTATRMSSTDLNNTVAA